MSKALQPCYRAILEETRHKVLSSDHNVHPDLVAFLEHGSSETHSNVVELLPEVRTECYSAKTASQPSGISALSSVKFGLCTARLNSTTCICHALPRTL